MKSHVGMYKFQLAVKILDTSVIPQINVLFSHDYQHSNSTYLFMWGVRIAVLSFYLFCDIGDEKFDME